MSSGRRRPTTLKDALRVIEDLEALVDYHRGNIPVQEVYDHMDRFGLKFKYARLLQILKNREGPIDHATLAACMGDVDGEPMSAPHLRQAVYRTREGIEGSEFEIRTIWGFGYQLVVKPG